MRFFESYGNPSDDNQMGDINVMQYIFLGDFCDRGYHSLEVIFLLFALRKKINMKYDIFILDLFFISNFCLDIFFNSSIDDFNEFDKSSKILILFFKFCFFSSIISS